MLCVGILRQVKLWVEFICQKPVFCQTTNERKANPIKEWEIVKAWTNFSLQDEPWAEFSTLEVAACTILCTYGPVLQNNLT